MVHCLNFVLACMTSSNPFDSEDRTSLNGKRTVAILYQLCFGLSQKCNSSQEDCHVLTEYPRTHQDDMADHNKHVFIRNMRVGVVSLLSVLLPIVVSLHYLLIYYLDYF